MFKNTFVHMLHHVRKLGMTHAEYRRRFPEFALELDEQLGSWPSDDPETRAWQQSAR